MTNAEDSLAASFELIDAYVNGDTDISAGVLHLIDKRELVRRAAFAFGLLGSLYRQSPECREAIDNARAGHE